jgi:hypothetical protein
MCSIFSRSAFAVLHSVSSWMSQSGTNVVVILVIQMPFLQGTVAMSLLLPAGILDVWPSVTSQGAIRYHLCSYAFVHSSFRLSLLSSFWCREVYCSWLPQDVLHFTGVADDLYIRNVRKSFLPPFCRSKSISVVARLWWFSGHAILFQLCRLHQIFM